MDEILETAKGVPLILKVIGQFLGAEDEKKEAYRIFKEERENWSGQIFDPLDRLDINMVEDLKDPFLDICSFFNGWYWQPLADIVGISTLDRLQKKGLLIKDRNSRVTVHEVFLIIGLEKSKGTRIMDANEISQLDTKGIKGLWFTTDQGREPIPAKKLDQVAWSLRILALQNLKVEGDYTKNFLELIYLDAGVNPLPSKASAFEKLTYLSYSPQNPEDLDLSQMPSTMKRLKLNGRLYSDKFRSCPLRLHGLQDLTVLKLFEFKHLTKLPKGFASLKCLRELQITDCDGFEELPTDLGELNQMSTLTIEKCPKLRKLPASISKLSSLRWLYLSSCKKLEDLSKGFRRLPKLQYLDLSSCLMLQGQWMDVIKKVKTLKVVDIRKSQKLLQKWQGLTDPPTTFSVKMK